MMNAPPGPSGNASQSGLRVFGCQSICGRTAARIQSPFPLERRSKIGPQRVSPHDSYFGPDRGCPMRSRLNFSVALAGICLLTLSATFARAASTSKQTFPQIVRISYLDGDVRVSRGHEGGAPKDTDWEKAVVNLPIQSGFSLATD